MAPVETFIITKMEVWWKSFVIIYQNILIERALPGLNKT